MTAPTEQLESLVTRAQDAIAKANDTAALDDVRIEFLGRKSAMKDISASMRDLDNDGKRELGAAINQAKQTIEAALEQRREALRESELAAQLAAETLDLTIPPHQAVRGRPHLLTQITDELIDIFVALGYEVADGPEIESAQYNFDLMNIPPGHPAREDMDTIYVDEPKATEQLLLRTHTSPVQARLMTTTQPPIAAVSPGRVYRQDTVDATHSPVFTQLEGIVVDKGITFADLRGTLLHFAREVFGQDRELRLLPDMFPFVEPGAQVVVSWPRVDEETGEAKTDWLEILGAGMIDPAVLEMCGIDPTVYSGFAFGVGVERIAMLRNGVTDIRNFYDSDARFLAAF